MFRTINKFQINTESCNGSKLKAGLRNGLLAIVTSLASYTTQAAVIAVEPGIDTLQSAIDAAEEGDILILSSGLFTQSGHLLIDKSLTLRSADAQNKSIISMVSGNDVAIGSVRDCEAEGEFSVTFQGLEFLGENKETEASSIFLTLNSSGSCIGQFNLLESELSYVSIASGYHGFTLSTGNALRGFLTSSNNAPEHKNASNVNIVGNSINYGGLFIAVKEQAYIAGNKITGNIQVVSRDVKAQSSYVIGNEVSCYFPNTAQGSFDLVRLVNTPLNGAYSNGCINVETGIGYILANKISRTYKSSGTPTNLNVIRTTTGKYVISNNLIELINAGAFYISDGSLINSGGIDRIFNNVLDANNVETTNIAIIKPFAITNTLTKVYNNITLNPTSSHITGSAESQNNNLCFATKEGVCPTADNIIVDDPQFTGDLYELAEDSPAIDAGVDDKAYYDLDGTIGDLGIHGGPYGFMQYYDQLQDSDKPFVYPVFSGIGSTSADTVQVKALVIPRMK